MSSEGIHIAVCANDRYFPGLFCTVGSALQNLRSGIVATFHVIDAGLSPKNKDRVAALVVNSGYHTLHWVDPSSGRFEGIQTGKYHISTYYRLALPELLDVEQVIYLDADMLVLSDLGALWDEARQATRPACAVKDWETLSLAGDSMELAELSGESSPTDYFNAGLLVLDLTTARAEGWTEQLLRFLEKLGHLGRFADQSALNFCLVGRIRPLDPGWNTPAWAFDRQSDNTLPKILHFTNQAPWLARGFSPSQALYERFALGLGIDVRVPAHSVYRSIAGALVKWLLAPLRMMLHGMRGFVAGFRGREDDEASKHIHIFRYWLEYFTGGGARCLRYYRRIREIRDPAFRIFPERAP